MKQKDVMWWHIGSWLSICFTCLNISVGEINLQPLNIKQNFCVCSFFCIFALKENLQGKYGKMWWFIWHIYNIITLQAEDKMSLRESAN